MKNFWNKLLIEDWVVVMLSIPLLILCAFGSYLPSISIPTNMLETGAWGKIAMLFVIALITLFAGNKLLSRPMKGMLRSFIVVFVIAALAMVIGSNKFIKNDLGLEPVFFSVIFGLLIRNAYHVPEWMKPAIQGEFYIKIGVVCLGATIMIGDVMKSGVAGLGKLWPDWWRLPHYAAERIARACIAPIAARLWPVCIRILSPSTTQRKNMCP